MTLAAREADSTDPASLESEIEHLDCDIDAAVYELYSLMPEEIAVVEASR